MGSVDLTGVTPPLFIVTLIFLLMIFSMLSLVVLRLFQRRFGPAAIFGGTAVVASFLYYLMLTQVMEY